MSNFHSLAQHIILLSESQTFEVARKEWDWTGIYLSESWGECPCGVLIKEHCYILNRLNGNETHVGNVCINRFMDIQTDNIFYGLKKIIQDNRACPTESLIFHAEHFGYIYPNEKQFLLRVCHRRVLSTKQRNWIEKINHRIIGKTTVMTENNKLRNF